MPGWQFLHAGANNHSATSTVRTMTAAGQKKKVTRMMMSGTPGTTITVPPSMNLINETKELGV